MSFYYKYAINSRWINNINNRKRGKNEKAKTDDKKSINYLRKRISKELGISGLFMPLTIIGYLFNCYSFIVLFYLCFNGFALISTAVMYAYKANSYDSMRK